MTCASCGTENPAGTRFCLECGSRIGETCRSCGAARIGAAKFCGECGTPFADAGPATGPRQTAHLDADATPVAERFVEDGKLMTAAGVSAGIDMALVLVARQFDENVAKAVQLGIEYDPAPPFDSGSPEKAAPELVDLIRGLEGAQT